MIAPRLLPASPFCQVIYASVLRSYSQIKTPEVEGVSQSKRGGRELTKWMHETWIDENKPNGTVFFDALKKYVNKSNSPIREHYTAGAKGAGVRWVTGSATNNMTKKAIQNKVSKFKNEFLKKSSQ